MSLCGGWTLENSRSREYRAISLFCRAWSCPDCRPRRLRAFKKYAADGNPSKFLTLTVNPAIDETVEGRARALSNAFKLLIKRARRKFVKAPIEYFAVFEETVKGNPHLHILLRAEFIPQKWLSDTMRELINAPVVDIRKVSSKGAAARYIAKYIAKGPKAFGNLKRYWSSKGYNPEARRAARERDDFGSPWVIIKTPLWMLADAFWTMGHPVCWESDQCFTFERRQRRPHAGAWSPDPLLQLYAGMSK